MRPWGQANPQCLKEGVDWQSLHNMLLALGWQTLSRSGDVMLFGKPESKRRCRLANRQALTDDAGGRKPYKETLVGISETFNRDDEKTSTLLGDRGWPRPSPERRIC